jgi:hypothetical protein
MRTSGLSVYTVKTRANVSVIKMSKSSALFWSTSVILDFHFEEWLLFSALNVKMYFIPLTDKHNCVYYLYLYDMKSRL